MARTPLLRLFRALHRTHVEASSAAVEGVAGPWRMSRRQFVVGAAALGLAPASLSVGCSDAGDRPLPRVGVVGAGIAGLHCAALLRGAGIDVSVFDAQSRVGGRMLTDRTTFAAQSGQHCELGGELVDTDHETIFDLAEAFGLTMLDFRTDDAALETIVAHFGGQRFGVADLLAAWGPVATRLQADVTAADSDDAVFAALDDLSISDWLDLLETDGVLQAGGVMRKLLEVAYTIEYGLEASEQSALNLVYLAGTDPAAIALFGASDELFHVAGGNDAIITGLAGLLPGAITLGARLTRITGLADGTVALRFATDGGDVDEVFDRVVLALPFTLLREVERVDVELSAEKAAAIEELGYGTNSKLMLGFTSKVWRTEHDSNGETFTDIGYQATWETSRLQAGDEGIITHFTGGMAGEDAGEGTPQAQATTFLQGFEQVFAGVTAAHNDRVARFHWPSHPFSKGSYACYRPGQWTRFFGVEGLPEGPLHFCGEHTSADFQGYMEGGAVTGAIAADEVATALGTDLLGLPNGAALTTQTPWTRIIERARRAQTRRDELGGRRRRRMTVDG